MVSRCPGVPVVSLWCPGGVGVVSWWCPVVPRWCPGGGLGRSGPVWAGLGRSWVFGVVVGFWAGLLIKLQWVREFNELIVIN